MRARFAPSPTGRLHVGNALIALLSFLQARRAGGKFLVRIEDLDRARCRPEYAEGVLRDLEYLGLTWDEPPVYQSRRGEVYQEALDKLEGLGRVYRCVCSRAEIARAASAPHGPSDEGPRYPGTCANERVSPDRPHALRFRAEAGRWGVTDLIQGPVEQDVAQAVGDFVVRGRDGAPSYQLAVVVDDAACGITHVLRGADLVTSTPRQLQLYRALGQAPPSFAHVGLLVDEHGKRLAKREGALAVAQWRERKVPPARLLGTLGHWAGLWPADEPATLEALVEAFSLAKVPAGPTPVAAQALQATLDALTPA